MQFFFGEDKLYIDFTGKKHPVNLGGTRGLRSTF